MRADKIGAAAAVEQLTGWSVKPGERDAIERRFEFPDFKTAWAFMSACALKAEQADHHPEWANVYNRVDVTLTTHDSNGVTRLDVDLAEFMAQLAAKLA